MSKNIQPSFPVFLKGIAMGAADVIPGVSGGTIAFITGIYEELIGSISKLSPKLLLVLKNEGFFAFWKACNANFLVSLFAGIFVSIFSLMRIANFLLEAYPILVWSFFFGLVFASVIYMLRQIKKWRIATFISLILSAFLAFYISFLTPGQGNESYLYLFLSGVIASCAMILPGISGAFILVLLGSYKNVTEAVSDFDLLKIVSVGIGAVVGLLSFSKLLKYLFEKYNNLMMAVLTGFIAGSLNKIWPWKTTTKSTIINEKEIILEQDWVWPTNFEGESFLTSAILCFVVGVIIVLGLEMLSNYKRKIV